MNTITDKKHIDRLNEKGIVIEDVFVKKGREMVRISDGSRLDQVYNASRKLKKYYYNGKCIYKEKNFDKNSNYTFATYNKNDLINCPNCGVSGPIKNFYEGCPYCDTSFNIDYGLKRYNFNSAKELFNSKMFKIIVIVLAILLPFIINYIKTYDLKTALLSILMFPISWFISYFLCCMLYGPILFIKVILNTYQESKNIKNGKFERKKIINSLNYELNNFYYNDIRYNDLIDYDIIEYYFIFDKEINNETYIDIKCKIRKYYFVNKKIKKKTKKEKIRLKYNNLENNNHTRNIVKCTGCGASIDVTKSFCEYCNTKVPKISEWLIDKFY